ncbi:hypothetical protein [Aeromicrobium sp. 179-A 4D2 NHS]|uniref:hypothetical protein n=1 Tax=Aeromicrobium sp. 179-A 4D2 NHS TaxID=3142375 RepID=UPI0039A3CBA6
MKTSDLIVMLSSLFAGARDISTGDTAAVYTEALALLPQSEVDYPNRGVLYLSDLAARIKTERFLSLGSWEKNKTWGIVQDMVERLYQRELADLRAEAAAA